MPSWIDSSAAHIRQLHDRIDETFRAHPHGPEHHAACDEFHRAYDSLAFPGGLSAGMEGLQNADPEAIELAVQFLQADPRFFRSGYIKETILHRLKRSPLTKDQQSRLAELIVRSVDGGGQREFKGYSRLARRIHPPAMLEAVNARLSSPSPEVVPRAKAVLHVLDSNHLPHFGE
jgi:hypothetical protein